jgi:hypothetical protein
MRIVWGWFREQVRRTKIEVVLVAALFAIIGGFWWHVHETRRSAFQPVSFSEYETLEDAGESLNNITWYYVSVNDFTAKIVEAYNWESVWSGIRWLHNDWFANKLDQATDSLQKIYRRNLRDFAALIPKYGTATLRDLTDLTTASSLSMVTAQQVDQSWRYSRSKSGHYKTVTTCTGSGKAMSCTTHLEYVCDYYHHTWTYSPASALSAARTLENGGKQVPSIQHLLIAEPTATNAWNEQVIRQSWRRSHKGQEPTEMQMLMVARFYKTGSQYEQRIDRIRSTWLHLIGSDARTWRRNLATSRTTKKTTGCHSTSGPAEYEFAQAMDTRLQFVIANEQAITAPIRSAIMNARRILRRIGEFILKQSPPKLAHFTDIDPDKIKGSTSSASRDVIKMARNMYIENIPRGNTDTRYRIGLVLLVALLAGAVGAGAGVGVDYLIDTL